MRRVILLALLALALPIAALANSVFTFNTRTFSRGTASRTVAGGFTSGNLLVNVIGSLNHMRLSTSVLTTGCNVTVRACTFATGVVTVLNPNNGMVRFMNNIVNGMVSINIASGTATVFADLVPGCKASGAGFTKLVLQLDPGTSLLTPSNGVVQGVPESGTLGLLGTGLFGLGGLVRRKLKLGT